MMVSQCVSHQQPDLVPSHKDSSETFSRVIRPPVKVQNVWCSPQNIDPDFYKCTIESILMLWPGSHAHSQDARYSAWTHFLATNSQPFRIFSIHNVWARLTKSPQTTIIQHTDWLPDCHQAEATETFTPELAGWRTVSSWRPSGSWIH